ncbi:hypothetical protein P689_122106 [Candidatus Riesia pediculischaeffi PTSU]|uniref:Uncharacterized protein n=1 Tax=Candidatus Riesia pediculischaeffi PTSU TaxID=1401651 RepID=A0A0C1S048_9ENTR|nr:hypothetical protein P689_122106 [Candidatus Riesia pediculischaeffi PTSU]
MLFQMIQFCLIRASIISCIRKRLNKRKDTISLVFHFYH